MLYKTGKVRHAFAAWHEGKVLPGCQNYEAEEGEKWTEADFPAGLPDLEEARIFHDGAGCQYQCRETIMGTARCHADVCRLEPQPGSCAPALRDPRSHLARRRSACA